MVDIRDAESVVHTSARTVTRSDGTFETRVAWETIDVVVQLTQNDHADLVEPDCAPCSDRLELEVVAAGS